jgi:AMP nucleosidase
VALDMESATIAANGFRFRVPYGTLLCVSDKPLHGEIKLPGMANHFYRERVDQHLRIGIRAIELLRQQGMGRCTAASCAASPRWRSSRQALARRRIAAIG